MKCLCCGKEISSNATTSEKDWCWHKKCVKAFFHTREMPILDVTREQLEKLANEAVNEGITIPGVQKKLSLHLTSDTNASINSVVFENVLADRFPNFTTSSCACGATPLFPAAMAATAVP